MRMYRGRFLDSVVKLTIHLQLDLNFSIDNVIFLVACFLFDCQWLHSKAKTVAVGICPGGSVLISSKYSQHCMSNISIAKKSASLASTMLLFVKFDWLLFNTLTALSISENTFKSIFAKVEQIFLKSFMTVIWDRARNNPPKTSIMT